MDGGKKVNQFVSQIQGLDLSMGIGETSRVTGATPTQIRYWEKKGMIHSLRHGEGKNKRYTFRNVATIMFIKSMIDQGYTLAKAEATVADHFSITEALQRFFKERLVGYDQTDQETVLNFGAIANDPDYDLIAHVGAQVTIEKRPHRSSDAAPATQADHS